MKAFLIIKECCIIVLTAALAFLLIEAGLTVRTVNRNIPAVVSQAQSTIADFDATAKQAQGAIADARGEVGIEVANAQRTQREVNKMVADAHDLLIHTDISLNGDTGVLPELTKTLESTNNLAGTAAADLNDTSQRLEPILADLSTGSAAFAAQTPAIMLEVSKTSKHVDATSANIESTTADIQTAVHRATRPPNLAWSILKQLWNFAWQAHSL